MTRWRPEYATGVQELDAEHQGLFALFAKLHAAIHAGQGSDVVGPVLDELLDYTWYHFAREEALMTRIGYPHLSQHVIEHGNLRRQVDAMRALFAAGEDGLPMELLQLLSDWLKCHTTTSDRRIGAYIRKLELASEGPL